MKLSSLEFLKAIHPDLSNNQLLNHLKKQNKDLEILAEHHRLACKREILRRSYVILNVSYHIIKSALMRSTQRKIADALQPRRRILPWLTLNEVFRAEFFASRPITLTIQADSEETFTTRSSGICVCTGSGSCFWFRTMNLQFTETIQTLATMATCKQLDEKEADELLHKYHSNLLFPAEALKMAYVIYEMYRNSNCPKSIPARQMCHKVKVKSRGFDAGIVLDGCVSLMTAALQPSKSDLNIHRKTLFCYKFLT